MTGCWIWTWGLDLERFQEMVAPAEEHCTEGTEPLWVPSKSRGALQDGLLGDSGGKALRIWV